MIDQIIRTRRKTIALIIQPDGRLIVRAPLRVSNAAIHLFVAKQAEWIKAKQQLVRSKYVPFVPKKFTSGEKFLYLGKTYPLEIVKVAHPALTLQSSFRIAEKALPNAQSLFESWYKRQAHHVITQRVQFFASQNGFQYTKVRITSARTRWGSCSSRGTLSFTWRLVMAPLTIIDYVVVHELVHLHIKNHSREFWEQVKFLMPDYQQRRLWLKEQANSLYL